MVYVKQSSMFNVKIRARISVKLREKLFREIGYFLVEKWGCLKQDIPHLDPAGLDGYRKKPFFNSKIANYRSFRFPHRFPEP